MLHAIPSMGSSSGLNGRNRSSNVKINQFFVCLFSRWLSRRKVSEYFCSTHQAVEGGVGISILPMLA